jgi:uncharacterized membrane protein
MNSLTGLGKYLYAVPVAVFGLFHFMNANAMAGMVPLPGGVFWVYLTGLGLLGSAVAIFLGKYDKLATVLLGLMLLIFALSIWLPGVISSGGEDQGAMTNLLKDLAMSGGAWMYANALAKDDSVIG